MLGVKISFGLIIALTTTGLILAADVNGPQFTSDGLLIRPGNYREWVYLSSGLGMTYGPVAKVGPNGDPKFDNVFVNPAAYRAFLKTGTWPDRTIFVLEIRASQSKGSINSGGRFQAEQLALEVELKDEKRFPGKWAFFDSGSSDAPAKMIPITAKCYSCHKESGAVDNTFVQFYPTLLEVARRKGTLRSAAEATIPSAAGTPQQSGSKQ
jgi:hypothetical protein